MKVRTTLIKPSINGWKVVAVESSRATRSERTLGEFADREEAEALAAGTGHPVSVMERARSASCCPTCGQGLPTD